MILVNSWVGEDAYITFRSVENFLGGYGLRWNTYERVQVFTHPLWMFGISFFGFFKIPLYYATLILSWICIGLTVFVLIKEAIGDHVKYYETSWIFFLLLTSRCFVDFSSSGLENPLSFLLILSVVKTGQKLVSNFQGSSFFLFMFLLSLAYLNRQDTVLFGIPFILYFLFRIRRIHTLFEILGWGILGFLPVLFWSGFSLIYYGYLFPNTAYAKLNTGISAIQLWNLGEEYFLNSFHWDIITVFTVVFVSIYIPIRFWKSKNPAPLLGLSGMILYSLYVCKIGGDFMAGRFIALPFVVAVFLLAGQKLVALPRICFALFLLFVCLNQNSLLYITENYTRFRNEGDIQDEKGAYFRSTNFLKSLHTKEFPAHGWATVGKRFRSDPKVSPSILPVCVTLNVGFFGYFAGPERKIIDSLALTDPLLSKIGASRPWRVGHFGRNIPEGYLESIATGTNQIRDKHLRVYYDRLKLLTESEDLFSLERLREIIRENTGGNEYLTESYKVEPFLKEVPKTFHCGL